VAVTSNYQQADFRHQDDPHREEHPKHHRDQGDFRRPRAEHLPGTGEDPEGAANAQLPQCDSLLIGDKRGAAPIEVKNSTSGWS
jgi:hypothetical protein